MPYKSKFRKVVKSCLWCHALLKLNNNRDILRKKYCCHGHRQLWRYKRGGKLNADHIKPYSLYPELKWEIDNGRTLCVECHKKTDTYGWKMVNYLKGGIQHSLQVN